ncbi:MAG: glycosyltransferase [Kiritimatiellae bacterium]|nr:glycosyltransferase [Kiritimatiellia bacterium]
MADIDIIMPTWNKAATIAASLDSVFRQKTSRTFRVIVADDSSTDRSLEIVAEYEKAHPGVITVLRSDRNLKLFRNVLRAYAITDAPFFCVLDPDDYWTDDAHLEKAVGFLSAHPDFTVYSAGIERLERDGTRRRCEEFPETEVDSDFSDYLRRRAVIAYTQTCVYRNVVFAKGVPDDIVHPSAPTMEQTMRGDSFRNFLHIREGKAHFSPGVEGCYRITDEGVYQSVPEAKQQSMNARFYADMWLYDGRRHEQLLAIAHGFENAAQRLREKETAARPVAEKDKSEGKGLFKVEKDFWRLDVYLFGRRIFSRKRAPKIKRIFDRRFRGLSEDEARAVIEWQYRTITGRVPDLDHPKTLSEKLQWIKWKRRDPLMIKLSDKVAVRDYIAEKAGEQYLVNALGVWASPDEIDFDALPDKFVLKVNWGCHQNIICNDKSKLDIEDVKRKLEAWTMPYSNHYYNFLEWAYLAIPARIIAEEFLDDGHGLRDYKFFCFRGEPKLLVVCDGRESETPTFTTYDCDFKRMDVVWGGGALYKGEMEKPSAWGEMLEVCRKLSAEMPFLRVDLYFVNGQVKVGELTCYPGAGWAIPEPYSLNLELGKLLPIPELGE